MDNNSINMCHDNIQMATTDNIKANEVSNATVELNHIGTASCVAWNSALEWSPCSSKCPKCDGHNVEINNFLILTSNPPQSQLRCKDCKYYFGSGIFSHMKQKRKRSKANDA